MKYTLYALLLLIFTSCGTRKKTVYFQDIDQTTLSEIDSVFDHPIIQVNDILEVSITALDASSIAPFIGTIQNTLPTYLVHKSGEIQFPIIGAIQVKGLTITEAQQVIEDSLSVYVSNPTVALTISNFKVTILGEVNNPGTYQVSGESVNILQAIGLAGDFSINGRRSNVLLIREAEGERSTTRIDFTRSDWLNESSYYVRQNDVIYVEPNYTVVASSGIIGDVNELLRTFTTVLTTYILLFNR